MNSVTDNVTNIKKWRYKLRYTLPKIWPFLYLRYMLHHIYTVTCNSIYITCNVTL